MIKVPFITLALAAGLTACAPPAHDPAETPAHRDARELNGLLEKPAAIGYNDILKHVLNTCTACHSLNGSKPDRNAITYSANLTSYESLFNVFTPVVTKGNLEDSSLYRAIAVKQSMPPAKNGYEPLSDKQKELLRLWIENCAPKDPGEPRDC